MQKLVYDNYNKFITATETIKEMKDDVFGMDHDMKCVRLNVFFNLFLIHRSHLYEFQREYGWNSKVI